MNNEDRTRLVEQAKKYQAECLELAAQALMPTSADPKWGAALRAREIIWGMGAAALELDFAGCYSSIDLIVHDTNKELDLIRAMLCAR